MIRKRLNVSLIIALALFAFAACRKDSPGKKIVDGLPISTLPLTIPPAQATQQYLLLNNVAMNIAIMQLNRLSAALPASISGPDNGTFNYSVQNSESHYGSATFTIQFQDINSTAVDPFSTQLATASIKYVHITVRAASVAFPTVTEDLLLTLDTVGILTGPYHMTGTAHFVGSSYSITYTLDPNSIRATISGFLHGFATAAGDTGFLPTSSNITFGENGDLSGTMKFEDQTDGIFVASNGSGYLTTNDSRILFQ